MKQAVPGRGYFLKGLVFSPLTLQSLMVKPPISNIYRRHGQVTAFRFYSPPTFTRLAESSVRIFAGIYRQDKDNLFLIVNGVE